MRFKNLLFLLRTKDRFPALVWKQRPWTSLLLLSLYGCHSFQWRNSLLWSAEEKLCKVTIANGQHLSAEKHTDLCKNRYIRLQKGWDLPAVHVLYRQQVLNLNPTWHFQARTQQTWAKPGGFELHGEGGRVHFFSLQRSFLRDPDISVVQRSVWLCSSSDVIWRLERKVM